MGSTDATVKVRCFQLCHTPAASAQLQPCTLLHMLQDNHAHIWIEFSAPEVRVAEGPLHLQHHFWDRQHSKQSQQSCFTACLLGVAL
jgi:hypothetical protein